VITNAMLARLDAPVDAARRKLQAAQAAAKAAPAKIPLQDHNPGMVRLDAETKLITHAIRMAAYNAETALARALTGAYARADDEAYALIREALTATGDIIPDDGTLTIRLDPLSAPRRTRALTALCDQLTATATATPAPSSSYATRSKTTPALHKRSPMSGVLSLEPGMLFVFFVEWYHSYGQETKGNLK